MRTVVVTGEPLTIADVVDVARGQARAALGPDVAGRMEVSRRVVTAAVDNADVVYGVTTGFGALADTTVDRAALDRMQLSLVRSHAAGVGDPLPDEHVRALLVLRARTRRGSLPRCRTTTSARCGCCARARWPPVPPVCGWTCHNGCSTCSTAG